MCRSYGALSFPSTGATHISLLAEQKNVPWFTHHTEPTTEHTEDREKARKVTELRESVIIPFELH